MYREHCQFIIEYIYRFVTILAVDKNIGVQMLLERYTTGDFSEKELESFEGLSHTKEEIKQWAAEMLAVYYD